MESYVLERIANSDEEAFRKFFEKYFHVVFANIIKLVNDKVDSEDLTQVVFIKLWEKRTALITIKSLDAYIFKVTYTTVIDYFRSNALKIRRHTIELDTSNSYESDFSSDSFLKSHEFESYYTKALQALPTKRREIFILSRHEGLTNKQISEKLNISIKTVENQMTSAIASMKIFFQGIVFLLCVIIF